MRDANKSIALLSACKPTCFKRAPIQWDKFSEVTGQCWMCTPCASRALNHFDFCVALSTFSVMTNKRLSGEGDSAYSCKTFPPLSPGLPLGTRTSIIFLSANNDMLFADANTWLQSK